MTQPPDNSTTGRHLPALDGLRGAAILLVLFCHLFSANTSPTGNLVVRFAAQLRYAGWIGVDLFFALSGFLITGILYDTRFSNHFFKNFYARRSLRIFPLYYGFILILVVISYALGDYWGPDVLYYLTYTRNLSQRVVFITNSPWVNINHFWTLAIEEQFYLVWPLLVHTLSSKRRIVSVALTIALLSFGLRCYLEISGATKTDPFLIFSWTPARLDTLLFGSVLAILVRSHFRARTLKWAPAVFVAGSVILFAYALYIGGFNPLDNALIATIGTLLIGLSFCALVASTLRPNSIFERLFSNGLLRIFGRYSYGLYVIHYSLEGALNPLLHPRILAATNSKLIAVLGTGSIELAVTFAAAALSFHFFEEPILRLKRYFHDDTRTPKLATVAHESN